MGQVEVGCLFPLRHVQVLDPLQEGQGSIRVYGVLRVLNLAITDAVLRKKLLRAFAARSARAVVPPLQVVGHASARGDAVPVPGSPSDP